MPVKFSYGAYYETNFALPAVVVIFTSAMLFSAAVSLLGSIRRRKVTAEKMVSSLLAIAIFVFLITINAQTLARGGIYLFSEKESHAVTVQGIVEKIEECDNSYNQKYGRSATHNGSTSFGVKIIMEGDCYYAITNGSLQPGDEGIITYLPKSRFVLRIDKSP